MKCHLATLALCLQVVVAGADAETVGIATTPPGSFMYSTSIAIATVVVEHTTIQARVQPQAGNTHNAVQAGASEFGIDNYYNVLFAKEGIEEYQGAPPADQIMLAARVIPLQLVVMARADSNLRTISDLKGLRIGSGYGAQRAVDRAMRMYLATAGLTYADMEIVPAQNVVAAADAFQDGRTDAFLFALGAGKVQEVAAAVGALRVLSSDNSEEAVSRARALVPSVDPITVKPGAAFTGVEEPTTIYGVDVNLIVNKNVDDDTVYAVVKAMYENSEQMAQIFPPLIGFDQNQIGRAYSGMSYHPGAIRFFKEAGLL
jgi:TRAP transporter TAXI family solute receptor